MRKCILAVAIGLVGILAGPMLVEAQEGAGGEKGDRPPRGGRMRQMREGRVKKAAARVDAMIESLGLDAGNQTAVRKVFESHREEQAAWRRENRELFRQMREAMGSGDQEAVKKAREGIEAHRKQAQENLMKQLKGLLNKEQMGKVKEFLTEGKPPRRPVRPRLRDILAGLTKVNLTQGQSTKIGKILTDTEVQIMKVLTPKQRKQLRGFGGGETGKKLHPEWQGRARGEHGGRGGRGGKAHGAGALEKAE